jgi:hypothetical protein
MIESNINTAPLEFWRSTTYTADQVDHVCKELDAHTMAVRITFDGNNNIQATLSTRCWDRQEGHYPSIIDYFGEIACLPVMSGKRGSIIVLLEDGLWPWFEKYAARAPVLTFGRRVTDHRAIVIPDPSFIKSRAYEDDQAKSRVFLRTYPWEDRRPVLFWRGAATGLGIESHDWRNCARGALVTRAHEIADPSLFDAKFTRISHLPTEQQEYFRAQELVDAVVPFEEFFKFRYTLDADGYACAWASLFLKLASGSTTLKIQSPYEQWYHRALMPWRHFVPVAPDLSDIEECLEWLRAHDDAGKAIADESRQFISRITYQSVLEDTAAMCAELLGYFRSSTSD